VRRDRGQLAIGLAFAFMAVCAIFGLLFNSAMMTREKMRLQQTTDYAALVAAQMQRKYLNDINASNQGIEDLYNATYTLMNMPLLLSNGELITQTSGYLAGEFLAWVETQTLGQVTPGSCNEAGRGYDHYIRQKLKKIYETTRDEYYRSPILGKVAHGNKVIFSEVLSHFLVDKRLPHGLRRTLAGMLGQNPAPAAIRDLYNQGGLSETLNISGSGEQVLFDADDEQRAFMPPKNFYGTIQCYCTPTSCLTCCAPGYPLPLPDSIGSVAKVVRTSDFKTNFLVSATYTPPNTFVDKTFAYNLRKPDSEGSGMQSEIKDADQHTLRLFNITDKAAGQTKTSLTTMALAKPFGGTFPKAGDVEVLLNNPLQKGDVGVPFTGSKLIGIADHEQIGNVKLWGDEAVLLPTGEYLKTEDFLH
jgi:hypothetical protein